MYCNTELSQPEISRKKKQMRRGKRFVYSNDRILRVPKTKGFLKFSSWQRGLYLPQLPT